jgi:hypothetical protein
MPTNPTKQAIWVAIEISSIRSSLHRWESCLITWPLQEGLQPKVTQIELRDIQTSTDPPITARFFAFQRHKTNQTQAVLYWYETSTFTTNQTTQIKHVKMSLTAYPTNNQTITQTQEQLLPIAQEINNYWQPLKTWGVLALIISQNGLYISTGLTILLIMIFLYYLYENKKEKKTLIQVYQKFQNPEIKQLIQAIHQINQNKTNATTKTITNQYQKNTKTKTPQEKTIKNLTYLEKLNLIKKQIQNQNDQPKIQWKNLIPTKAFKKPKTKHQKQKKTQKI